MYLLTSPDLSLRSEVLFKRLSAFFDVDPGLQGQAVLLWESDQLLKNLMDIHAVHAGTKISSFDGVFIYRTLSSADILKINQWAQQYPHLSFYLIESGIFSIAQEAAKLAPEIQSRVKIISSESTHHFRYPQFQYIFINKSEYKKKTARPFIQNPIALFRKFILLLIQFTLTPVQTVKDFYATYNLKYFYGKISIFLGMIWSFLAKYTPKYILGMIWSFLAKYTPKYILGMVWSFLAKYNPQYLAGSVWSFLCEKIYGPIYSFIAKYNLRYFQGLLWTNFLEGVYNFFCKYNVRYVGGQIWVFVLKIFFTLYHWVLNTLGFVWLLLVRLFWGLVYIYHRIHEFNMKYTFYPIRRFYWILRHEFKKRILGVSDESH